MNATNNTALELTVPNVILAGGRGRGADSDEWEEPWDDTADDDDDSGWDDEDEDDEEGWDVDEEVELPDDELGDELGGDGLSWSDIDEEDI